VDKREEEPRNGSEEEVRFLKLQDTELQDIEEREDGAGPPRIAA